ncbi:hypothetical protein [Actinokineospora globicatena]|uniref:Uncharacterized protein n=1 Tax=Actinokineospora globicatena TaxID=103729 RepID=A0A9W6V7X6_9PSEU|nr:hypothetical protein [Actinokineospora globicatena]GLW91787.1 hypothetical protein Aglo03_26030 [Actinokineospora globicatena]
MARTAITPQTPTSTGATLTYGAVSAAAAPDGNYFDFDGSALVLINNASGSSITLTIDVPISIDGVAVADRAVTCPTGQVTLWKPNEVHRQPNGQVHLNWSSATSVTVAVLNV